MDIFKTIKQTKKYKQLSLKNLNFFIDKDSKRYNHILGVIKLANDMQIKISLDNNDLYLAALYHDIGYSEKLHNIGFHPIDSAIKAYQDGVNLNTINAILCHTGAKGEAQLKDVSLSKYYSNVNEQNLLAKLLTYCDIHVNANGEFVTLEERLDDIFSRYKKNHLVYINIKNHIPYFNEIDKFVSDIIKSNKGLL